ncbi:DUF402 domain-containing protein [Kitasatospora sp. NPDC052868]|uniref:DUF402 domain-containing protein n=1 Tax=Kitasatospora sp. NPDC052868 TaxID=3364060 RepID=UPI0037CB8558
MSLAEESWGRPRVQRAVAPRGPCCGPTRAEPGRCRTRPCPAPTRLRPTTAGKDQCGPYCWQGAELLSHFLAGEWFSVHCFQEAATKEPLRWYMNFERPYQRRPGLGIDTMDLALDLVVTPDLSGHHWKDQDLRREAL